MKKETMMKILEDPQSYSSNERLSAARLALTFLDLLSVNDNALTTKDRPMTFGEDTRNKYIRKR